MANSASEDVSSLQKSYKVTRKELPVSCPLPNAPLWNLHPRVFLALSADGKTRCPYCGAEYVLGD